MQIQCEEMSSHHLIGFTTSQLTFLTNQQTESRWQPKTSSGALQLHTTNFATRERLKSRTHDVPFGLACSRERLRSQAGLDTQPTSVRADRCKINFVRRVRVRARQIKLMEQISPVIKIKIGVSYNLA